MFEDVKQKWGFNFVRGSYAVAVGLLYLLLLRTIAVQITPPPVPTNEPYPDVNSEATCEDAGGRWINDSRAVKSQPVPQAVEATDQSQGYCQGPLAFERVREAQSEKSKQTSLFVFAIGGALAVAASVLIKNVKVLPAGFVMGGIVAFFIAGVHVWQLVPGIGRLVTMIILFLFILGVGWYSFQDKGTKK